MKTDLVDEAGRISSDDAEFWMRAQALSGHRLRVPASTVFQLVEDYLERKGFPLHETSNAFFWDTGAPDGPAVTVVMIPEEGN